MLAAGTLGPQARREASFPALLTHDRIRSRSRCFLLKDSHLTGRSLRLEGYIVTALKLKGYEKNRLTHYKNLCNPCQCEPFGVPCFTSVSESVIFTIKCDTTWDNGSSRVKLKN